MCAKDSRTLIRTHIGAGWFTASRMRRSGIASPDSSPQFDHHDRLALLYGRVPTIQRSAGHEDLSTTQTYRVISGWRNEREHHEPDRIVTSASERGASEHRFCQHSGTMTRTWRAELPEDIAHIAEALVAEGRFTTVEMSCALAFI